MMWKTEIESLLQTTQKNQFHLGWRLKGETINFQTFRTSIRGRYFHKLWVKKNFSPKSVSSVQPFSRVQLFVTPWTAACQASLSITNSQSLLKPMSIESIMTSNHFILCCPLLLPSSIFPNIRVFSNESALCIRWPKYWSFSFNISPSNEYSWLISFRMDWLGLLAVQETLKSLLQHNSSKASILWPSAFFMFQLSHPYVTTGKTIALTSELCWQSNASAFYYLELSAV